MTSRRWIEPAPDDDRVRRARLTRAGRAELAARFEEGFDPSASLPAPGQELIPPNGAFLAARVDGQAVASGAVKRIGPASGSIKRMWVDESLRGLGLGRRLLEALEAQARELGIAVVRLETNRTLVEARRLYASAEYREVPAFNHDPYANHWFEKELGRPPTPPHPEPRAT